MPYTKILLLLAVGTLAACESGGTTVRVGGSAGVGVSTGFSSGVSYYGPIGPPPGRTASERGARRDYYRGPRGQEF